MSFKYYASNKREILVVRLLLWLTVLLIPLGNRLNAQISIVPIKEYVSLQPDISKQTFRYAEKDSVVLDLDVYSRLEVDSKAKPCVIFVFGGAFVGGRRDDSLYNHYFNNLVDQGFVTVSISYRLGLKGVSGLSIFNTSPLKKAVDEAVEDLFDATAWVIDHHEELGIDTSKVVISGSSSGAITCQTAEYYLCNQMQSAAKLPADFRYAGLVTFSGAILGYNGNIRYATPPAPTLMFHGTADKIVPYHRIKFFNRGLFGSSYLAERFKKNNYPYFMFREEGMGHEISVLPMIVNLPIINAFLKEYVLEEKPLSTDVMFKNPEIKPMLTITAAELFEKLKQKTETENRNRNSEENRN